MRLQGHTLGIAQTAEEHVDLCLCTALCVCCQSAVQAVAIAWFLLLTVCPHCSAHMMQHAAAAVAPTLQAKLLLLVAHFWIAFWICFSGSLGGAGLATIAVDMPAAALAAAAGAPAPTELLLQLPCSDVAPRRQGAALAASNNQFTMSSYVQDSRAVPGRQCSRSADAV
jgi:hypothetical protein